MNYRFDYESPLGTITLASDGEALTGIWFSEQKYFPAAERLAGMRVASDLPVLKAAAAQLAEYFHEGRKVFDLPLAPQGTPFQRRVWDELQRIKCGDTTTYGSIARTLGLAGNASRAVGSAVGRNPISLVIPCHRVVGHDGGLTGYAGGLHRKQRLLVIEGAAASGAVPLVLVNDDHPTTWTQGQLHLEAVRP